MKRLSCMLMICFLALSLAACGGMSISSKMYNEISDYVTDNMDSFSPTEENEFYDYKATGLSIGGVYYGYYYSSENEWLLPDFYGGNDLEKIQIKVPSYQINSTWIKELNKKVKFNNNLKSWKNIRNIFTDFRIRKAF